MTGFVRAWALQSGQRPPEQTGAIVPRAVAHENSGHSGRSLMGLVGRLFLTALRRLRSSASAFPPALLRSALSHAASSPSGPSESEPSDAEGRELRSGS